MELLGKMESQGGSISSFLKYAVLPIAKVLVMCGLGFLMATPHINILSSSGRKLLSKLVFVLFLPCLIFTQLGKAVTLQKIGQWWFIPINVLLASTVGCLIGLVVAMITRPPREFFKFTIVMIGVGNIGNIPLVLIGAVCRDKNNPFGDSDTCNEEGVAYISFGQWVGAVIVYTFVFHMLSPTDAPEESSMINHGIETSSSETVPLLNNWQDNSGRMASLSFPEKVLYQNTKVLSRACGILDSLKIKQILQPPVTASILALVVGAVPFLKRLVLADDAPLFFFSDSLNILGGAMIPCIMLVLGGNLIGGAGSSQLGLRSTIAITFTRLLIVPPTGFSIVYFADKLGYLPPNDKMFRFVLLLQHTMPTSILAGTVASLRGVAEKEASAILFWEHICAIFSMTGWLILYFHYLSTI
eukprot:c2064_g1_i1 orf=258-1499(+)